LVGIVGRTFNRFSGWAVNVAGYGKVVDGFNGGHCRRLGPGWREGCVSAISVVSSCSVVNQTVSNDFSRAGIAPGEVEHPLALRRGGNLALKVMATAGLFIGGGIAPKIISKLKDGTFMQAFTEKGRMRSVMEAIPVRVILNDETALLGAAHYAELRSSKWTH